MVATKSMAIVYTAVVRNKTIIASFSPEKFNYEKDVLRLLPPTSSTIEQFILSNNVFSFFTSKSLTFACVTMISIDRRTALNFLDIISKKWFSLIEHKKQIIPEDFNYNQALSDSMGDFIVNYGKEDILIKEERKKLKEEAKNKKKRKKNRKFDEDDLENCAGSYHQDDKTYLREYDTERPYMREYDSVSKTLQSIDKESAPIFRYQHYVFFAFLLTLILYIVFSIICGSITAFPHCL